MIRIGQVRPIADSIARACEGVMEAYRAERTTDEPDITGRLLSAIEGAVNRAEMKDGLQPRLNWSAMTLRAGSGSAAHEKRYGADLLGVFQARLPDYRVAKGFLGQAKRAEPGEPFSSGEWNRLQDQCEKMLGLTPDSFVVVYSKRAGVRFVPALSVQGLSGRDLFSLYMMAPRQFFERHFQCFIGDRKLHAPKIEVLDAFSAERDIEDARSRYVLRITVGATDG